MGGARAGQRQAYLLDLDARLREAPTARAAVDVACEAIGPTLRAVLVTFNEFDEQAEHLEVTSEWRADGTPSALGRHRFADYGAARMPDLLSGRPELVEDVTTDPRTAGTAAEAAYARLGCRSSLNVPLLRDGRVHAMLAIGAASPHRWTEEEVSLAGETVDRVWQAAERLRAEVEARRAAGTFRHLVRNNPFGIYLVDSDFCLTEVAQGARKVFASVDPLLGRDFDEVLRIVWPEPFASEAIGRFRHTLQTGEPYVSLSTVERRADIDATEAYDWRIERITMPDGRFGVVCYFYDLSERERLDAALRASEARHRFLSELDEGLRGSRDATAAMFGAATLLARHLDASRCAYADVDADSDRFVIRSDYTVPGLASSAGTYSLDLFGPRAAADMRAGRTLVIRDVGRELASREGREMFQAIGIDAIVCCPLVKDGRLVAMMAVHQSYPRDWQPEEIELVEAVVERCWAQVERVGAEARLRASEARYRQLFEAIDEAIMVIERLPRHPDGLRDWRYLGMNPAALAMFRVPDLTGRTVRDSSPHGDEDWYDVCDRVAETGEAVRFERASVPQGMVLEMFVSRIEGGPAPRLMVVMQDVTERRAAEGALRRSEERLRALNVELEARVADAVVEREAALAQLHEAQKLETVGQLTGGIAHDFNNLLTPIVASLDILERRVQGDERAARLIAGASQAAERASVLVSRLLAFARRQTLEPRPVDLAALVAGMRELVERSLGPQIRIVTELPAGLPAARVDPNQLELALLNLCVNARDAMPGGGTLTMALDVAEVAGGAADTASKAAQGLSPGRYVRLSVIDTGVGMTPEVLAHAIEPFYTTKGTGRGTGLGLSMVHGLAAQSGGALRLASQPDQGTRATMWLPAVEAEAASGPEPEAGADEPQSLRPLRILLVDDEDLVRAGTADLLDGMGHVVLQEASGAGALERLRRDDGIDLLLTDHLMPGMTGVEMVARARELRPGLRAALITGFASLSEAEAAGLPRLGKPFRDADLARLLGEAMDGRNVVRLPPRARLRPLE